ncbi:MAG: DsrE family protein [Candidatus Thiodiazotropha sp. (ex Lucinoma borealis)]|nr:DsrE family protein [Candidatus Thiodiazotropha sp. (ex Lucinoma borealis)]
MSKQAPNDQLYVVTTFDEPDRVSTPLVLANCALAAGRDVVLWLTMDGVKLARKGEADKVPVKSFAPLRELLNTFTESGGRIGVCPPCGKTHGLADEDLLVNAEWMGAAAMLEVSAGRQTHTF